MSTRKLYEIRHYFSSELQEMVLKVEEHNILDESWEIDETGIIIYNGPVFKERLKIEEWLCSKSFYIKFQREQKVW